MLVGLLTKNAATCACIWELQKMTLLWKEVDRMPNVWCLEFYGKHVRMTCSGNEGLLMLQMRSRQMNRLVTYNVMSREWLKVPGCVVPRGRKQQREILYSVLNLMNEVHIEAKSSGIACEKARINKNLYASSAEAVGITIQIPSYSEKKSPMQDQSPRNSLTPEVQTYAIPPLVAVLIIWKRAVTVNVNEVDQ
ncbi:hypothetical protein GOBAR_DD28076 [Gossypium barbadense]|nr:hypothetical protein GOBAR_DD28076 [Gossypium barbadense]